MEIIKLRYYGQPKINVPKELKTAELLGSIKLFKNCACKVWKLNDAYYILHRDWFSGYVSWDRALETGIIQKKKFEKFVYNDSWGGVILRNEAIFKIIKDDWYKPTNSSHINLCINFARMVNTTDTFKHDLDDYELVTQPYTSYFENFLKLAGISEFDNYDNDMHCGIFKRVKL